MLIFGYTSDHYSRKWSLFASTVILILFAALSAGSYGAGGSSSGLFAALTAWRFLLGIGIGGEYPAGSVGCAESTGELKSGTRNRWFILFTNVQIDIGFVVSALVPMIVVCHLSRPAFSCTRLLNAAFYRFSVQEKTTSAPPGASAWALVSFHLSPSYIFVSNSTNPKPTVAKQWQKRRPLGSWS